MKKRIEQCLWTAQRTLPLVQKVLLHSPDPSLSPSVPVSWERKAWTSKSGVGSFSEVSFYVCHSKYGSKPMANINKPSKPKSLPPWLFPSVVSSSLWDSGLGENLGLRPRSRTGLEKGLFSQFYRLSATSLWAWSEVRQDTELGVLGRDPPQGGVRSLSLCLYPISWCLEGHPDYGVDHHISHLYSFVPI